MKCPGIWMLIQGRRLILIYRGNKRRIISLINCSNCILCYSLWLGIKTSHRVTKSMSKSTIWLRSYIRNISQESKMDLVYKRLFRRLFRSTKTLWSYTSKPSERMLFWEAIPIVLHLWIFFKEMQFWKVKTKPKNCKETQI